MNSRYKDLAGDTVVFMVGNLSVKLIQFVLLPVYTTYMSAADYGVAELLNNLNELLYPLVCLGVYEAAFRFAMDKACRNEDVLASGLLVWALGSALALIICAVLHFLFYVDHALVLSILLVAYSGRMLLSQFIRGCGDVKTFAISGVLNAGMLLILSYIFIGLFDGGVDAYLGTMAAANAISLAYVILASRKEQNAPGHPDFGLLRQMLSYCLPLIPNSLAWWFNNLSNRYVVLFLCGPSLAGQFAAASKLPSLINMFTQVFQQSWQISAIKTMDDEDRSDFSTNVFRVLTTGMIVASSGAILLSDVFAELLLKAEFIQAKRYVPILMLAVFFCSLASFLGTFYTARKESRELMRGTIVAACVNIASSICLTLFFGVNGCGVGLLLSNAILMFMRLRDIRRFIVIDARRFWFIGGIGLLTLQAFAGAFEAPFPIAPLCCFAVLAFEVVVNGSILRALVVARRGTSID